MAYERRVKPIERLWLLARSFHARRAVTAEKIRNLLLTDKKTRLHPWAHPLKGGYTHEALLPGRAGRLGGRRPCGLGDSTFESLKRK